MSPRALLLAGNLPYAAAVLLCGGAFFLGASSVKTHASIALAEKGGVVVEAVLVRGNADPQRIDAEVTQPVMAVLRKYADQGYLVVDVSRDESGHMALAALPADAIDITAELRAAVKLAAVQPTAAQSSSAQPTTTQPASAATH